MTELELLRQWVQESQRMVFLGGAGVSTASGIPDFRSAHGLYQQKKAGLSYEEMLSHGYFVHHTAEFYDFLRGVMLYPDAKPNGAHYALARLEREGRLRAVITQNIDGLHQMAGSREVLELHGSTLRNFCEKCGRPYDTSEIAGSQGVPRCPCGGVIKPDVVLYEESLDSGVLYRAVDYIRKADVLIIGGTSLVVYPAAGLIDYYQGHKLVLINKSATGMDARADLVITGAIGQVLGQIAVR